MKLNTFNDVAKRYSEIKPLVSKHHTLEDDVRPIADRRRKHLRIERVHSDKYILRDTLPMKNPNNYGPWYGNYLKLATERPPITWEILHDKKGNLTYEQITVRGGITHSHDTSRYNFLREYLPRHMYFHSGSKHFIRHKVIDIEKGVIVGEEGIVRSTTNKYVDRYIPRPEYRWQSSGIPVTEPEPDYLLTFRRKDKWPVGVWDFSGPFWPEPRVRIDKRKKKSLKPHIDEFYEWMCIVGPLMPYDDWDYRERMITEINEHKQSGVSYLGALQDGMLSATLATEIVMDYNHPLRTHLAWHFLTQTDIRGVDTQEAKRKFRNDFNRRANNTFDLQYTDMIQMTDHANKKYAGELK